MTTDNNNAKLEYCPALITIKIISGKWKTRILWLLRKETMQFNQLKSNLKSISAKMLTEHLRQLENDGVIFNTTKNKNNVNTSFYHYTDYGKTLIPVLDSMGEWGLQHQHKQS